MNKRFFMKHLSKHGCSRRQGSKHEWWVNAATGGRSAVPRHNEISEHLAKKICRDLGVPDP